MNAIKFLEANKIEFSILNHSKPVFTSEEAAQQRGVALSQITKCMICKAKNAFLVFLIPGDKNLDFKKAKLECRSSKLSMVPREDLENHLHLTVGAISPFGLPDGMTFYIDNAILNNEYITVSSGSAFQGLLLKSIDLVRLINGTVCDLC